MSISVLATSTRREFLPERFEPGLAILGTKDDAKDDLAEPIEAWGNDESRFQR
jgi:hypothetical protein